MHVHQPHGRRHEAVPYTHGTRGRRAGAARAQALLLARLVDAPHPPQQRGWSIRCLPSRWLTTPICM